MSDLITVNKTELLARLSSNRESHAAKVAKARQVYRAKIVEELDRRLGEAKSGRDIDPGFLHRLPIPRDFTEEYDRAIDQYSWHVEDTVELTRQDFNRYVRDEWEWVRAFTDSNSVYLAE